ASTQMTWQLHELQLEGARFTMMPHARSRHNYAPHPPIRANRHKPLCGVSRVQTFALMGTLSALLVQPEKSLRPAAEPACLAFSEEWPALCRSRGRDGSEGTRMSTGGRQCAGLLADRSRPEVSQPGVRGQLSSTLMQRPACPRSRFH